jgi:N-alpha-acetyltransferase 15/16, NatA auxiliary subunit
MQALKMFTSVIGHFAEFAEDQYDFHNYCLRKVTLRGYLDMIRMQDNLYQHEDYVNAATAAVDAYVALHDEDRLGAAQRKVEKGLQTLTDAARKKALEKRAKDADKATKAKAAQLEKARLAHNSKKNAGKFDEVHPLHLVACQMWACYPA